MSTTTCPIEFRLERSKDKSQPYFWSVWLTDGSKRLAFSETYVGSEGAANAVAAIQAGNVTYAVFEGEDRMWYFHIRGLNNRILARSAYRYYRETSCTADQRVIEDHAADASYYDCTAAA
jgi:hypothetical protein